MPSSRPFGLTSSSVSSRHANRARRASDDEDHSDADDYRRVRKALALPPSSKTSHKSSASTVPSRSKRTAEDEEEYDQVRPVKKSQHKSSRDVTSDAEEEEPASALSGLSEELLLERKAYDEWVDKKLSKLTSKREQMLEERVDRLRTERDEIQSQYDELRQLRNTAPERALEEFKKVAEARYRHDKDLIASLKVKVEAAEKRAKETESGGAGGGDRSISILNASVRESVAPETPDHRLEEMEKQHRKQLVEAQRMQKRLEEDVKNYKLQLEQEIAQSKALLAAASSSSAPASSATKPSKSTTESTAVSNSLAAMEDEKAVRKLYEDLTGLVVTGVERISSSEPYRRFKAIFAQEDYYSILMDLEESSSKVNGGSGEKAGMRDDIVYVPKIDEDRDSELLNSDLVPQEWLDALRFDRNMLFKWYEKTRKALLTDEARLKLRAREERNRH
ncbi:hypothetical protein NDA16_000533 [Ustilago loliicola]|nr:hypothetical protein NDA16_000533 [Ustilago loliicola]